MHGKLVHKFDAEQTNFIILKKEKKYKCELCAEIFTTMKNLCKHKEEIHNEISQNKKRLKKQEENRNIKCELCGELFSRVNWLVRHINNNHKETTKEQYYLKYILKVEIEPTCKQCGKKVNFRFDQGFNDFCCFSCSTSWYAKNTNRVETAMKTLKEKKKIDPTFQLNPVHIEYWLNKGFTKEQAFEKVKERQTTFNLEICIKKYGEVEGLKRWKLRQEKWNKNFKKRNYSTISQEVFWTIYNKIEDNIRPKMFFAQNFTNTKDESGKNHEYCIETDSSYCKLDFYIPELKYCIEFDGDYWHGEKKGNLNRDNAREFEIKKKTPDITIIHIKERDYKANKEQTVNMLVEDILTRIKNGTTIQKI